MTTRALRAGHWNVEVTSHRGPGAGKLQSDFEQYPIKMCVCVCGGEW